MQPLLSVSNCVKDSCLFQRKFVDNLQIGVKKFSANNCNDTTVMIRNLALEWGFFSDIKLPQNELRKIKIEQDEFNKQYRPTLMRN